MSFDAGDRIIGINGIDIRNMNIEQVRNLLRGDPDTNVVVKYRRDDHSLSKPTLPGIACLYLLILSHKLFVLAENKENNDFEVVVKRNLVRISDVRLATLLGDPNEGLGYINLSGFNAAAGKDFRTAFLMLRYRHRVT